MADGGDVTANNVSPFYTILALFVFTVWSATEELF